MRLPPLRFSVLFASGLGLILLGMATCLSLKPGQTIVPLCSVVGSLAMMTAAGSGRGPGVPH